MARWARAAAFVTAAPLLAHARTCQPCNSHDVPMPKPHFDNVTANNGVRWPTLCLQDTPEGEEEHVFTIGDWGGMGHNAETMDNRKKKRKYIKAMDLWAQHIVARIMKKVASEVHPKYILNVGDNFYPGGIDAWCNHGGTDACSYLSTGQWDDVWEAPYAGPELGHLEWWSVLGNHDWGGADTFSRAWDQQIAFTWHSDRWLMPGLYWERKVQYCDFSVDYYFLDTNIYDVAPVWEDPGHNFCNRPNWGGRSCTTIGGPTSPENCVSWFEQMYATQIEWLKERLAQSTADWQIIVTHFPPQYGIEIWRPLFKKYGVDIFVSGHRHQQEVHYKEKGGSWHAPDLGDTAWTVTGGGGGVTSEGDPRSQKETALVQQYGFMDLVMFKDKIHIDMYSAASQRKMSRTTVYPVPKDDSVEARPSDSAPADEASEVDGQRVAPQNEVQEDAMPFETAPRMDNFRGKQVVLFDEVNASNRQRCSANRRRVSYMRSNAVNAFKLVGAQVGGNVELDLAEDEWSWDPTDPNLLYAEHTDEDCYDRCGNRSGKCDFFCGVGMACCAKGSATDAPECKTAEGFTKTSGEHECVGLKGAAHSTALRKRFDVEAEPELEEQQSGDNYYGGASRVAIGVGAVMILSGIALMASAPKGRRELRPSQSLIQSGSDEDPVE
eukprot:TRINITY_DN14184_c0_g2_i2.p1 TRINITY_DN14184_c0_g2~~TRINITY_DN14184_c0_g2_i2.p1  ORF type:complete len:699 (+),score=150.44 TRINITY_DN14184_c0_g2_i2:106-2097(+)